MQPNWAEENLQVIRTLMERAGLYRRALAPVMLALGVLGVIGWEVGKWFRMESFESFTTLWFTIAAFAIAIALLIIRRQALNSVEPFWTGPTKRVAFAMLPPLTAGLMLVLVQFAARSSTGSSGGLEIGWPLLYGCALHSAGQFISRGVRLLGWGFISASVALAYIQMHIASGLDEKGKLPIWVQPNAMMGMTFGGLHLVAAAYLYFTEKPNPTP
ncbi:MAG: hypothetical protein EB141_12130 [Verrucomicrobia bacterium]|nr:hypothetical protein [Verrucomicrobiota bacterium]NBU07462.1 hypothetical protein [Pseudomonadota bacterium]NDA67350.1 hypothetical protein [Verrucomicrobiota bacterium]NDB76372.1 hypothetical protein [Verrucomicrobiota bacterium]NDD39183.1 hypothetical protein [Verrucomicrobiota bacterium]